MRVFTCATDAAAALKRPVVAIGNFDGLHVGHARVLAELAERARLEGAPSLVMSFRPHPAQILSGRQAPPRLLSDAQREEILDDLGIDGLLLQPFDEATAAMSPQAFAEGLLVRALGARGVVVGASFRFGSGRTGDLAQLHEFMALGGGWALGVTPLAAGGDVVSSSRIRRLVAEGHDEAAAALLGRPFVLEGMVVEGDRRGRTLGFPTANIHAPGCVVPARGVHACVAALGDSTWNAVANIGTRPTFAGEGTAVEVHVLGEPGDIYGRSLRVAFIRRLRDERRFRGPEELSRQIRADIDDARAALASREPASWRGPGF